MSFSNTRLFKLLPFMATGAILDTTIRYGIYLQNKYLLQCTAVTLTNITSLHWIMPDTSDTPFREYVLDTPCSDDSLNKLFTGLELGISDSKAHLLTTKNLMNQAVTWTDQFTAKMQVTDNTAGF